VDSARTVASITGAVTIILTVTDPERSAAWYARLLGLRKTGRYAQPTWTTGQRGRTTRPDALGIDCSGVKQPHRGPSAMITFRDPDNIQLKVFWNRWPAGPSWLNRRRSRVLAAQ
jgi:hypothetical protein